MDNNIEYSSGSFQHVRDRSHYRYEYKDGSGNIVPATIRNQRYELSLNSQGTCVISLYPYECSVNSSMTVKKSDSIRNIKSEFTTYTVIFDREPSKASEVYFNREKNYIQFYYTEPENTREVVVSFQAIAKGGIYAGAIITRHGADGEPLEYFEDLYNKNIKALETVNTLYDFETEMERANSSIANFTNIHNDIISKAPKLQTLHDEMEQNIPIADSKSTTLSNLIGQAEQIESRVVLADNKIFYVNKSDMYLDNESKLWCYDLEHNLASSGIQWDLYNKDTGVHMLNLSKPLEDDPTNVLIVRNEEPINIKVVANRGYYGGV